MAKAFLPDYENCSVNFLSSIAKKFKVSTGHKSLECVDKILSKTTKNIVVILLDGLGEAVLKHHLPEDSFLRKNQIKTISSVFPTTTTSGTMSFKTGLTPLEHGWISAFLYFKEVGSALNLYLNTDAYSRKPVPQKYVAETVLGFSNFFEKIEEKTKGKVKAYGVSIMEARDLFGNITQLTYDNLTDMCSTVNTLCSLPSQKVIYAYHNYPDDLMHKFGPYSDETAELLIDINAEIENLAKTTKDTTFIISADHGQTEVNNVFDLANYPDIADTFIMPPTGGSRAFNVFIKHGKEKTFLSLMKKYFKDEFLVLSKKQVLDINLFGINKPHPKVDDFLGDFWIISTGHSNLAYSTLYKLPIKQPRGAHGGLTKEEMFLPLIVYQNKEK